MNFLFAVLQEWRRMHVLRSAAQSPHNSGNGTINETLSSRAWESGSPPKRILVIRFHAIGDVAITLPACVALRRQLPDSRIDYLTMDSSIGMAQSLTLFDSIMSMTRSASRPARLFSALKMGFKIRARRYDVLVDLQRNRASRLIRQIARPESWSEFNRFAELSAAQRTLDTFHAAGFHDLAACYRIPLRPNLQQRSRELLIQYGWNGSDRLVLLNPAGLWETRNWNVDNYVSFARIWLQQEEVQFLLLGDGRISEKTDYLQRQLGGCVVNLVQKTSLEEAFAILQHCSLALSEDSGLMHMAWVSGIPTIALLGSTRHDWAMPMGSHTRCFHSGDLDCGACMSSACMHGDVRCLTRYRPEFIFEAAQSLLKNRMKELGIRN
jgi:heptosyltransferase II